MSAQRKLQKKVMEVREAVLSLHFLHPFSPSIYFSNLFDNFFLYNKKDFKIYKYFEISEILFVNLKKKFQVKFKVIYRPCSTF